MASQVFILSSETGEKIFSNRLKLSLSAKGCEVFVAHRTQELGDKIDYLVVLDFDGKFGGDKRLRGFIGGVKNVFVGSVKRDVFDKDGELVVKNILIDQVFPEKVEDLGKILEKVKDGRAFVPKEAWVNLVSADDLVLEIEKELFSFPERKTYILGKLFSFRDIISAVSPGAAINIDLNLQSRLPVSGISVKETLFDPGFLKEISTKKEVKKYSFPKKFNFKKPIAFVLLALFLAISSPYLFFAIAGGSSLVAYKLFSAGEHKGAGTMLSFSQSVSKFYTRAFLSLPMLPLAKEAIFLSKGTALSGQVLAMADYAPGISGAVFGRGDNLAETSQKLALDLDSLYREISFLSSETVLTRLFFGAFAKLDVVSSYRENILTASRLSKKLPDLLGYDRPKTYMVLLQNNMELRPTGGFIGSFSLLTFSKGKLIDNTIYDVYSADGQIKGYVAPPKPIEEHLGEASWSLRDSNWDPDFPVSAARAEWFLDKTLDRSVDGVLAVNLEVFKRYLDVLGPLYLPEFGDIINRDNMYEKVQYEVEADFFPGSRKKAHYLASLATALILQISTSGVDKAAGLLAGTLESLDSRDIQVYLKDPDLRQIFSEAGWSGEVKEATCSFKNCLHLLSGIVEANLGVNKANYFVRREVRLKVSLKDGYVEQEVTLFLKNTGNIDKTPEHRYKSYVRAMAPSGSSLISVRSYGMGSEEPEVDIVKLKNRVEYGAIIDVPPGEEKFLEFKWKVPVKLDFSKAGELGLVWWKQSGVGEYPFYIEYDIPEVRGIVASPPSRLTEGGSFLYNTTLSKDFRSTLKWK